MTWPRNVKSAGKSSRQLSQVSRKRVMRLNALSRLERQKELESIAKKPESPSETDPIG
jgi:hypothetical protein